MSIRVQDGSASAAPSIARDPGPGAEPSLGELFSNLSRETSTLVHEEVALAKAELSQKVAQVGKDVAFMAVGGVLAYAGFLTIVALLIILLAKALPWWASTLLVAAIVLGVGGYLIQRGIAALKALDLAPRQTVATLKEDLTWAKEQTH